METTTKSTTAITTREGGWHSAVAETISAATGVRTDWQITWRTQPIKCCQQLTPFDGSELPVFTGRSSFGDLQGKVRQCGGCGRNFTARWTAEAI